jgi:hypothetical protein
VGDLLQPAGPDAVGAFLVFLHLLEGEAERIAQFRLASASAPICLKKSPPARYQRTARRSDR